MVYTSAILAALLAALPAYAGLYPKSSKVLQVNAETYHQLIALSNHTSIVEFYAPWCGHCKNLQPHYEKAAANLQGLANVAAVDCDEDLNKAFCGQMGVKGFPTLKIVKAGKTPGKPIVDDYNGERTAKAIVDAVIDKIPNLVKKVEDKTLEKWLEDTKDTPRAILFTDKGKTSALWKSVAIDFKGSMSVAQIRNTEKASVELFGITKFPTLISLPTGEDPKAVVYDGEMKKEAMVQFLSQSATPNPDPAPPKARPSKSKDSKKSKSKEAFESASKSQASEEGKTNKATATDETLVEEATESPSPEVDTEKPVNLPVPAPPISILETEKDLQAECMGSRTGTCILALLPATPDEIAANAVGSLSEIAYKHKLHQRKLFPFYVLPEKNVGYKQIKDALSLSDMAIVAVNGRRGWWRALPLAGDKISEKDVTEEAIGIWVDSIRMGEGAKQKLPEGLIPEELEETAKEEPAAETSTSSEVPVASEEPIVVEEIKVEEKKEKEQKPIDEHDEL